MKAKAKDNFLISVLLLMLNDVTDQLEKNICHLSGKFLRHRNP